MRTGPAGHLPDDRVLRGGRRHLHVLAVGWRAAVAQQLEYRADLAAKVVMSAFWLVWAAVGVSVYFRFAGDVAGWTYPEVLVVVGLFFAVNGVRQAFLAPNLDAVREYVRRGTLDHVLLQPVDSQVLVSLRHVGMANLADPVLGLGLVAVGCALNGRGPGVAGIASSGLLLAAALVLLYALDLALIALSVLLVGVEDLGIVSFSVVELSRFPVHAYREPVRTVLTVVPVAFLTTLPAEALLGRLDPGMLLVAPAVAGSALAASSVFWHRALRGYTGASA